MVDTKAFVLALVSVGSGWLLSELSHALRASGARRKALGRVLAELLEVRHYLRGIELVFTELRKKWPFTPAQLTETLTWVDQLLPPDPDLPKRYGEALTEIATVDPLLAFQLRNKERIPDLLVRLRAMQIPVPEAQNIIAHIDDLVRTSAIDAIDEVIRSVAWEMGPITWLRVVIHLRRKTELPEEAKKLFALAQVPSAAAGGA